MAKILIVHDYPLVVEGLFHLLCSIEDIQLIRHVNDERTGLDEAYVLRPDIVIIDGEIVNRGTSNMFREFKKICNPQIVILRSSVTGIDTWEQSGVVAIFLRHMKPIEFLSVMKRIIMRVKGRSEDSLVVQQNSEQGKLSTQCWLTSREQMVLGLMSRGMTSQEMADNLRLSKNTIRYYAQIIIEKLGVRNRIQAVTKAQELGLMERTAVSKHEKGYKWC